MLHRITKQLFNRSYLKITKLIKPTKRLFCTQYFKVIDSNENNLQANLFFAPKESIHEFYSSGDNIMKITLPTTDPNFKLVSDPASKQLRANKIIPGQKYSLFEPLTYYELGLDITKNIHIVDRASELGRIDFLNWWVTSGFKLSYSNNAIDNASKNGRIDVLNWWINSGLELKYSIRAISEASNNGHPVVLVWWINYFRSEPDCRSHSLRKDSSSDMLYLVCAILYASILTLLAAIIGAITVKLSEAHRRFNYYYY